MLDSSGKVRDGFFDANLNSLGNQPQCMAVSVEKSKLLWNGTTVITNKFMYETFKSSMFAKLLQIIFLVVCFHNQFILL